MTGDDTAVLTVAVLGFLLAGVVKGVIGAGLPMVAVPILASVLEPAIAVAVTVMPVLVSNLWQALQGGHYRPAFRRFWPFLLGMFLAVTAGAQVLASADPALMAVVLGSLVVAISGAQVMVGSATVPVHWQPWLNPVAGTVCGLFGGIAGMLAPSILYSAALRLPKDLSISLLGLIALSGTTPLYISLAANRVLDWSLFGWSGAAVVPVLLGMALGRRLRDRISQAAFERFLLIALVAIGLNLIRKGLS